MSTSDREVMERTPIDVTRQHDFVQIVGGDRCGLRGCTLGVLEHAWIPSWEQVRAATLESSKTGATSTAERAANDVVVLCSQERNRGKRFQVALAVISGAVADKARKFIEAVEQMRDDQLQQAEEANDPNVRYTLRINAGMAGRIATMLRTKVNEL